MLMGLRCLIGHDYGGIETSRDRRERGSEVVVTVREYRECSRCGHRRVLSENKEVTAKADPEDDPAAEPAGVEATWSAEAAPEPEPTPTVGATYEGTAGEEPLSAEEDDGIILEDEPETTTREYGAWPDREPEPTDPAGGLGVHDPWPDVDEAAAPASGGAEVLEGGFAAESQTAESEPEPAARPPQPDPEDAELVCPDCGENWPSVNASLRPGDICPECRRDYLDEQVIQ